MSGGGGGGGSTETTVTNQNIPKEVVPYFTRALDRGEAASQEPYQPYGGQRIADNSADTNRSYEMIRDIAGQGTPGADAAAGIMSLGVGETDKIGAGGPYQYTPFTGYKESEYTPFTDYKESEYTPFAGYKESEYTPFAGYEASKFSEFDYSPTDTWDAKDAAKYMDPYIQNVLSGQKRGAREDYQIENAERSAKAIKAGAFGGSRAAVQQGLAERDLLNRMTDIDYKGLSSAYNDAATRFGDDRTFGFDKEKAQAYERQRVEAGLAGEADRVQAGNAAELARVQLGRASEAERVQAGGASELERIQSGRANEAKRIQEANAAELERIQSGRAKEADRVQAGNAAELERIQSGQAGENRDFYNLGLDKIKLKSDLAGNIADLESKARAGDIEAAKLLAAQGKGIEGKDQASLDMAYEDFLGQRDYPMSNLERYTALLHGSPLGNTRTSSTSVPTNPVKDYLGMGISALGLYNAAR